DRAAAGHVEEPDDVAVFDDRLPAEQMLHAVEQRADAAASVIGNRRMTFEHEGEFLVLGADAEFRPGLAAVREPRDEIVARFDRRHVDLVTCHFYLLDLGEPLRKGRDLTRAPSGRA